MKKYDVTVIGGGPAGLAAAISACEAGASVCLIEREKALGGVLKQCIHDGFGLIRFREKLTGPEYAERFIERFRALQIPALLESFVTEAERGADGFCLSVVSASGIEKILTRALVLATGCRERSPRQAGIYGTRPAGLFTAGSAQNFVNLQGQQVTRRCVILGSGDIGLIMARRLTLEGAQVLGVYEIMNRPSGLPRNLRQCLDDFHIPLHLSTTVTRIFGEDRVGAVEIARVDEKLQPIPGTEERLDCDALIVSVGLIPENELARKLGVEPDARGRLPLDTNMMTAVPGIFACGNCYHVYDLADNVSESGELAGRSAAAYVAGTLPAGEPQPIPEPVRAAGEPERLTCLGCPNSCLLTAEPFTNDAGETDYRVSGNRCPRGIEFARSEMTDPVRSVTSTVATVFPDKPRLPVRTDRDIPKSRIPDVMNALNHFILDHPVQIGDILIENIAGTPANLIPTTPYPPHIPYSPDPIPSLPPLVLTFDLGTQSLRALLCRKDGSFLDKESIVYETPYFSPEPGWAEQKPLFYYEIMCRASQAILTRHPEALPAIKAVTVTTIRDTVLCLDEHNEPLRNIIVWLDQREADYSPRALGLMRPLFGLVGMENTAEGQYRDSVCNWLMQHEPETWEKTAHFVLLSAFLNYKLSGELKDSVGSTIAHMPFDYKKRRWMGPHALTRCMNNVPSEKLIELVEPGELLGHISETASRETGIPAGVPIIATGSDKGCETIGLSVCRPDRAALSFGTSSTVQNMLPRYVEPLPFLPAYPAACPGAYNQEIQIYRGFWTVRWFIRNFCGEESAEARRLGLSPEEYMDSLMKDIAPGSDGLFVSPYWSPGVVQPLARGSMIGFTDKHTKAHIYRAIIEGINFELMKGLARLEKTSGRKVNELYAGGGGARSDTVLRMTADMFGLPVKRLQTHESSSLGSSMVAFVSLGEYPDLVAATEAMCHEKDVFLPDAKRHAQYEKLYKIYEGLYDRMTPIYKQYRKVEREVLHE